MDKCIKTGIFDSDIWIALNWIGRGCVNRLLGEKEKLEKTKVRKGEEEEEEEEEESLFLTFSQYERTSFASFCPWPFLSRYLNSEMGKEAEQ